MGKFVTKYSEKIEFESLVPVYGKENCSISIKRNSDKYYTFFKTFVLNIIIIIMY